MDALEIFTRASEHPTLAVPQHVIIRAVRALPKVEALALIRGAYTIPDGAFASLEEATLIYSLIKQG
jgi:hypothetical protein